MMEQSWFVDTDKLQDMLFPEAAEAWLESCQHHIAPRTYRDYIQYIRTLGAYFGKMRPQEISADQVRAYQRMRRAGAKRMKRERIVCFDPGGDGEWALRKLVDPAATKCNCTDPEHYLIPFKKKDHTYDPTRQCSVVA